MARILSVIVASLALALTSAFVPMSTPITRSIQMNAGDVSRTEFLKQSLAAAAAVVAPAAAMAAVVEPEAEVNYGKNPASWQGGGKAKSGQIKTGNAGSILKK